HILHIVSSTGENEKLTQYSHTTNAYAHTHTHIYTHIYTCTHFYILLCTGRFKNLQHYQCMSMNNSHSNHLIHSACCASHSLWHMRYSYHQQKYPAINTQASKHHARSISS